MRTANDNSNPRIDRFSGRSDGVHVLALRREHACDSNHIRTEVRDPLGDLSRIETNQKPIRRRELRLIPALKHRIESANLVALFLQDRADVRKA